MIQGPRSQAEFMDHILHPQRFDERAFLVEKPFAEAAAHRLAAGETDERAIAQRRRVANLHAVHQDRPVAFAHLKHALRTLLLIADEEHRLGRKFRT